MSNPTVTTLATILVFIFVLAGNLLVFGIIGPALVSAASTIAVICGIVICVAMFLLDLFLAVTLFRSLYNYNQPEKENS